MKTPLTHTFLILGAIGALTLPLSAADESRTNDGAANSVKAVPPGAPTGVVKIKGEHWLIKDGQRTKIGENMTPPAEVMIDKQGKVTLPGGKAVALQDGQFVSMEGQVSKAPKELMTGGHSTSEPTSTQANVGSPAPDDAPASKADKSSKKEQ
jgi:hypothetical protein